MRKSRLFDAVCAFFIGACIPCLAWSAPITITEYSAAVIASDVTNSNASSSYATPVTEIISATRNNSSSETSIGYIDALSGALLSWEFLHSIDNTTGDTTTADYAASSPNHIRFIADTNTTYNISGTYGIAGPSGTRVYLFFELFDITDQQHLFKYDAVSFTTANELFTLGSVGDGDSSNINIGTVSGNLIAGHDYGINMVAIIQARDAAGTPTLVSATAAGDINLLIGTVPIPPALWLFGSGLLGLIGISRRKKPA